ncbi:uncharacterized protein BJX67DRAFT_167392 [Aspergillus lucknowensis]|uniref:Uncharacterized protein n=1 Tax=Aspergillus lucknowensis TaxID=176173 RepID=A0ABR4M521_9EURO
MSKASRNPNPEQKEGFMERLFQPHSHPQAQAQPQTHTQSQTQSQLLSQSQSQASTATPAAAAAIQDHPEPMTKEHVHERRESVGSASSEEIEPHHRRRPSTLQRFREMMHSQEELDEAGKTYWKLM